MKYAQMKFMKTLLIATMVAFTSFGSAQAEQAAPAQSDPLSQLTPEQREKFKEFQQKRAELQQLGQELNQIRQQAVTKHPELKEKQEALGNMVAEEMKNNGGTPKEDLAELRALQSKLQDQNTPDSDRQALMVRLQRKAQAFEESRRKALENPKLQKAQGELLQAMMAAMKEQDPRTEQIMMEMQQKQQEMIEIRNSAQAAEQKK